MLQGGRGGGGSGSGGGGGCGGVCRREEQGHSRRVYRVFLNDLTAPTPAVCGCMYSGIDGCFG